MNIITRDTIRRLQDEDITSEDITKIMSDAHVSNALENGADFCIHSSVEDFGEDNSDNDLFDEENESFEEFGHFLLSVPGAWQHMKLPSGKVLTVDADM